MFDGVISIPFPPAFRPHRASDSATPSAAEREFVAGPENRLAAIAVLSLAHGLPYNPLVLHGPPGAGKSFLAEGIAAVFRSRIPRAKLLHLPAIDFARRFADAIETSCTEEMFAEYRELDLLVLEDLHLITDKPAAQQALVAVLDQLLAAEARVIVTLPTTPGAQNRLLPALSGRLLAGLAVPLSLPGVAARREIVARTLEEMGLPPDEPGARVLIEDGGGTVRELRAAVRAIDIARGGIYETGDCVPAARRKPSTADIAGATAKHYGMKVADLRGVARPRHIALARGVAMFLSRELTENSLTKIGDYFGRRHHTTVMCACRKLKTLVEDDQEVRRSLEQLRHALSAEGARGRGV